MSKDARWFEILQAARKLGDGFTGSKLAETASIERTEKSTSTQIASAWLLKFEKWGYVARVGLEDVGAPRPAVTWKMTEKGTACRLQESLESRFNSLLSAVRKLMEASGKGRADETAAWKKLCAVVEEVDL